MKREYYSDSLDNFLITKSEDIFSKLAANNEFALDQSQRDAWLEEIKILQSVLSCYHGSIYFEYSIPRMGRRIDVLLLIGPVIFVLEFKIGEKEFTSYAVDQVYDYALDLKNFHETSHKLYVAPVLVATKARHVESVIAPTPQNDRLIFPIKTNIDSLSEAIKKVLDFADGNDIVKEEWESGRYCPTPTIIEAAMALYRKHSVTDILRNDAKENLTTTTDAISEIIYQAKKNSHKAICFVTGVPGAGKTLIGLNIATKHLNADGDMYSVLLSGNKPLVDVLQEALARDKVAREKKKGNKISKKKALSEVRAFVQIVHHYRDEYIKDPNPPVDHVALFDEAQRAWDINKTADFMKRRKKIKDFDKSEPEFLISCINRHDDWGVVVCLVGGGQEIHTGEAGIGEWIEALNRSFPDWHIHISDRLNDSEYGAGEILKKIANRPNVYYNQSLHLAISMRSFRAEHVSSLVKELLDIERDNANKILSELNGKYPIVITRDLTKAKQWLKKQARGSERYGIVVSSQAERLKPHAINVKAPMNPIYWFLNGKEDVRSSYCLEDVATEFDIQGLELDWACITWDADFRFKNNGWDFWSFRRDRWNRIRKEERKNYLKNAYRVLLTRARQGMVIVVPLGDSEDSTRNPIFYDATFEYLKEIGFATL
jgi:hypothetical protein